MESIIFTTDASIVLAELLGGIRHENLFIVADKYTVGFCDRLFEKVDWIPSHVTVLDCGEEYKSIESVSRIWTMLSKRGARRSSILVCVGGGVVTDLGGFAASTFKRGMHCINVPTTLLAQVDASLGGKTGFNFNGLKNEIGTFSIPEKVIIDVHFLSHLPVRERMSGFAEMIKHGLLSDREYLTRLLSLEYQETSPEDFLELIRRSVTIKGEIVSQDPREQGLRKVLNFGHTIGHCHRKLVYHAGNGSFARGGGGIGIGGRIIPVRQRKRFPGRNLPGSPEVCQTILSELSSDGAC